MSRVGSALGLGALVVSAVTLMRGSASAHFVPRPCDFITSGGFVFDGPPPSGAGGDRVNFGAHGGCKNEDWWGGVNVVDHGGFDPPAPEAPPARPYHIKSTEITGYLCDPAFPNARDICGIARTNAGESVRFRVRLIDNGEGTNASCKDEFGIRLSNQYIVTTRPLAAGGPGGGNVQFHDGNPSTTSPCANPDDPACAEFFVCGGLEHPGNPAQVGCPANPDAQANCPF